MKKIKVILYILAAILIVIQFVPANRTNPAVTHKVVWDSPQTQDIFKRACADCHSNETVWPWYSRVAPISFMVANHVNEGRAKFNISDGNLDEAKEAAEAVEKGAMPLGSYLPMHPEAKLSPKEKQTLIDGLIRTFGVAEN
jgi:mono/diheme cytochrome c family protein